MDREKILKEISEAARMAFNYGLIVLAFFTPGILNAAIVRALGLAHTLTWLTKLLFFLVLPSTLSVGFMLYLFALLFDRMHQLSTLDWLLPWTLGYGGTNFIPIAIFLFLQRSQTIYSPFFRRALKLRPATKFWLLFMLATTPIILLFSPAAACLWVSFWLAVYFALFDPPAPNGPAEGPD